MMVIPKKAWIRITNAYEMEMIARPTRAAVMRSRAAWVLPESPPEVSH